MCRLLFLLLVVVAACTGAPKISSRIQGGSDADIKDTPYLASIEEIDFRHVCGAVIISSEWVLTDAICQYDPEVTDFQVRVGSSISNDGSGNAVGVLHDVVEWIEHPDNDVINRVYDFALLKVSPPFVFNSDVAFAVLPEFDEETPNDAVGVVAGWGETEGGVIGPVTQLQSARMSLINDTECIAILGGGTNPSTLCAKGAEGGVAVCWHDEGSPLVADGKVYGISVWTQWCGNPDDVQLFSRVATVRDWIDATINP